MEELKSIIARNIAELRRSMNLTQAELAQKLNYSDKAVSKWEREESIPDVTVLKEIADLFGVSVDYLLQAEHSQKKAENKPIQPHTSRNRVVITLLSVSLVFFVATMVFVNFELFSISILHQAWMVYIYAVPLALIVLLVFNSLWGKPKANLIIVSLLVWSVLADLFLSLEGQKTWLVFIMGVPAQVIILLWAFLKKPKQPL